MSSQKVFAYKSYKIFHENSVLGIKIVRQKRAWLVWMSQIKPMFTYEILTVD
jgi:hypothetical protein